MGGHDDHGQPGKGLLDDLRGLEAVHAGHFHIHQHTVEPPRVKLRQALGGVGGPHEFRSGGKKHFTDQKIVHLVVVHDQDFFPVPVRGGGIGFRPGRGLLPPEGESEVNPGAFARFRFDAELFAQFVQRHFHHDQAEAAVSLF